MATTTATAVTRALYGGVFDIDGAGHFPGLELINLIVCCTEGILPSTETVHIRRASHDFARQLVTDQLEAGRRSSVLLDRHTEEGVAHLLRCLQLEVPNAARTRGWERTHFFPYTRSLVHWDARKSRATAGEVQLERRYYRGAGAYAFSVLRRDPDERRLEATRTGLAQLYPQQSSSPLEMLSSTLRSKGRVDDVPSLDQVEAESVVRNDVWDELYRDGMHNIVGHVSLPAVQRVWAVMNWTSIWLCLMEAARTAALNSDTPFALVVDCAGTHPQLRRAAQRCLKDVIAMIEQVSRDEGARQGQLSPQQLGKIRGFFGITAAAGGLLNAWRGRRHLTLRLNAIEALVLAAVRPGAELEYETYLTDWLFGRCGIVAGRESASRAGMLTAFDGTIFEENERRLAEQMRSAGMLRVFSDATRMVSPGGQE